MTIEEALTIKLTAVLGYSRIYPDGAIPQGQKDWPCVVYEHAGDDDRVSLAGRRSAVRVDSFSLEFIGFQRIQLAGVREQIKTAFSGANCRGLWGAVFVTGAIARDANSDAVAPDDGSEKLYRTERLTLTINWRKM
jgi:hypothetical protein